MHGVVTLKNGKVIDVVIGEKDDDPVFTVTDLLPHLGQDQSKKPLGEAFNGEHLNVLAGGLPYAAEDADRVKLTFLSLLNSAYGITERDLITAELSLVPAGRAKDVGLDRSMIGAYGQDDRVCSYGALRAVLDCKGTPEHALVCALVDKEEIGSEGISGMQSAFFDTVMRRLCAAEGADPDACYEASQCLSADVTAAYDPTYSEAFEKRNSALLNAGVGVCKYTGARGKGAASDASSEYIARIAALLDENGVAWQASELGRVDLGGGGTVAKYVANRNIPTLDVGTPVLCMHAPFEVTGKLDVYMTYRTFSVFDGAK
jgi:aspartyl aminopeptidase